MLLTGATGFLGSRLCAELLRRTQREIVCLVRATSVAEAEARLRSRLHAQDPDVADAAQLRVLVGDFTRPHLGLTADAYRLLARQISVVYHCGAAVNMAAAYEELAPVNVAGTRQVLDFCRAAGVDRLHHISTMGVFLSARRAGMAVVGEDAVPSRATCSEVGYPRSKYDAEELVRAAAAEGLAVRLYRPALVLADSRDGACPHDDFTARLLAAATAMGSFPLTGNVLPVLAVDHAAQAIAALSLAGDEDGRAYPLMRPEPFPATEFFHRAHAFGYRLAGTTAADWQAQLKAKRSSRPALAMRALSISRYLLGLEDATRLADFQAETTTKTVADLGVVPPSMDTCYFTRMFTHLIEHGVLPRLTS